MYTNVVNLISNETYIFMARAYTFSMPRSTFEAMQRHKAAILFRWHCVTETTDSNRKIIITTSEFDENHIEIDETQRR